jgi:stage IV sporulation protein FB
VDLRFSLLGVPVAVNLWFFLLAMVIAGNRSAPELAAFVGVAFVSILAHEMAHALAYRAYGYKPQVAISGLINSTSAQGDRPLRPRQHLLMVLAGPAATLALAGLATLVRRYGDVPSGLFTVALRDMAAVNLFWGIFNLIPMLPMDGGQAVLAVSRMVTRRNTLRPALAFSMVVGVALVAWAALGENWFNAFIILLLTLQNAARWRDAGVSATQEEARAELTAAALALDRGAAAAAEATCQKVLAMPALDPEARGLGLHILARALTAQQRYADAAQALEGMPPGLLPDPVLFGNALRMAGRVLQSVQVLEDAFRRRPTGRVAREYALSLTEAGQWAVLQGILASDNAKRFPDDVCAGFASALFDTGHTEEALHVQGFRYQRQPNADAAHQAARACARLGRVDDAITWLSHAVRNGFSDVRRLEDDEVLRAVRDAEQFGQLRQQMRGA